ncbi:hypothetical protein GCM10010191_39790 [Actinomadura vinacea]|uniref:Fibronectin attachment protein n=1 Tax=Actinomadura vinacea TaxID=115336 RepID=A0ABN3J759_9ACTN
MSDNSADREKNARVTVPEVEVPEPEGRTDFSSPGPRAVTPEAEDVKVAPVPQPAAEEELFGGEGDPLYAGVAAPGPTGPVKPGKPSSGNWQMPDWMADEDAADTKLGRSTGRLDAQPGGHAPDGFEDGGGRGKLILFGGVGLLVLALLAAGGVYLLKQRSGDPGSGEVKPGKAAADSGPQSPAPRVQMPPGKPLKRFPGRPSKMLGMVTDPVSGLAYPRLAKPWQPPTKAIKLGTPGWSGQQVLVTERRAAKPVYGQVLIGALNPALRGSYTGPESVPAVAVLAAKSMEQQYYRFPHKSAPLASQALTVDGRKGWLVASYITYKRAGVRATGEVVATAVIDSGRAAPAVAYVSVPNTHRAMWPDVNQFLTRLKVSAA